MEANTRVSLTIVALLLLVLVSIQLVVGENATEGEVGCPFIKKWCLSSSLHFPL